MNDVELRWVMRMVVVEQRGDYSIEQKRPVLQYRKWRLFTDVSGDRVSTGYCWSDWIDVPTVEE